MTTSTLELEIPEITDVRVTDDTLAVDLADGRSLSVPLVWYPRLAHSAPAERADWQLIGRSHGIHWPQIDEDISVTNLLAGQRSGESPTSFKRWLSSRESAA